MNPRAFSTTRLYKVTGLLKSGRRHRIVCSTYPGAYLLELFSSYTVFRQRRPVLSVGPARWHVVDRVRQAQQQLGTTHT